MASQSKGVRTSLVYWAMLVFGLVLVFTDFGLGFLLKWLSPVATIALLVLGVLMIMDRLPGGTIVGGILVGLSVLLLLGFLPQPSLGGAGALLDRINLVVGIVLIVVAVVKLAQK